LSWALRHAWIWGALYLATIPVAAGVFAANGDGFFDSNLAREAGTESDISQLEAALSSTIDRIAARASIVYSGQRFVVIGRPVVEQVARGQGPNGTFVIEVYGMIGSAHQQAGGPFWFELGPQEGITYGASGPTYTYEVEPVGPDGLGSPAFVKPLSLVPAALFATPPDLSPSLTVGPRIARQIDRLSGAYAGNPSEASGLYLRMLYLSATTITTLGLGDIQPISSTARLWVSIEAVAGIVLAGLFLNAVARGRRTRN
jgi:hypothetical protein